ncbi:head protein [Enterococcus sp. AZ020]|uniref:head protein n=1 Tax=Enterococcus sp. AZ020 TaxID=2774650 RepID=UPI003D2C3118
MAKTPKLSKSALKYWEKRRDLEDKVRLKLENETLKMITDIFPEALKRIQEKLLSQSDLHKINQQKLLEDVKQRDQEKYRKYIEENYKSLMNSDEKYQAFIDEFFPAYDYAKVNRLLQIRSDIFSILAEEMIKKEADAKFNDRLDDFVNRVYNTNANALGHILGTGDFSSLPKKEIERMLNYPWSGKTFSSRLWGNVSKLEQNLSQAIVNAVASGGGVTDALKTMRQDPTISDMFKLEKDKFNRAIENLVRTEYAHFAVEGINASFEEAGVKKSISWSAEDERVCSICGGYHGKEIKKGGIDPPYHTRCRCTKIPSIPDLGEDIDTLYESMFGDLLDEFAKNEWGIALNRPNKPNTLKKVFDKTNMKEMVGTDNYNAFLKSFESIKDGRVKELLNKFGDQLSFNKLSSGKSSAQGKTIQLSEKAFKGSHNGKPMQKVFHELGHFLDARGAEAIGSDFDHISEIPSYKLKNAIKKDLLNLFNKDLSEINGEKHKQINDLKKLSIFDQSAIVRKYKKLAEENPYMYSSLSDMMESTGVFVEGPLGSGHGLKYWKISGMQETEFFAHMLETVVNEESRKMMYELFPEATKKWEKMLDDILKKMK